MAMMNPTAAAAASANLPPRLVRTLAVWFVTFALALSNTWWTVLAPPPASTSVRSASPPPKPPPPGEDSRRIGAPPPPPPPKSPAAGVSTTIGVAVTVTGCSASSPLDGAVVLRHSIRRQPSDRYKYRFYAIYHPEAAPCVPPLADAGYTLLERDPMVNVSDIKGEYLRGQILHSGCCGEKELIKFEAFLLTQHPAVILMDMDMLVLKPLDDLIDLILGNDTSPEILNLHVENVTTAHGPNMATGDLWLLYVNDYFTAAPPYSVTPSQGGFAVLKPNRTIYSEIQQIVLEGNFHPDWGWGNATGAFWGGMTFQGLLPYYFQILRPGYALALDFCTHDHIHFPPTQTIRRGNETSERCIAPRCRDCQRTAFEDTFSVHLTLWDKPWDCETYSWMARYRQLAVEAWFRYRSELEASWGRSGRGSSNATDEALRGYCSSYGSREGYEAIRQPYGAPV